MVRRLFWLSAIAGVGYMAWRWLRQQNETQSPPAYVPPVVSSSAYAPPPLPSEAPASAPATGPRRIPTRVHRGAPPSRPTPSNASEVPADTPEGLAFGPTIVGADAAAPPADADADPPVIVGASTSSSEADAPAATTPPDLADLVSPQAEVGTVDLGELAGPSSDAVDLGELATLEAEAGTVDLGKLAGPSSDAVDLGELATLDAEVSSVDLAPLGSGAVGEPAPGPEPTNINSADEAALVALPGIGPALARRIIAYREEHGPFASIDQLEAVQGIGRRNLDELRHLITV